MRSLLDVMRVRISSGKQAPRSALQPVVPGCVFVFLSLLVLVVTLSSSAPLSAKGEVSLYISNRPFSHQILKEGEEFYAPLEELLKSLNVAYEKRGLSWYAAAPEPLPKPAGKAGGSAFSEGGPSLSSTKAPAPLEASSSPSPAVPTLFVNNTVVKGVVVKNGRGWVPVKALAARLGYRFVFNQMTGILDLFRHAGSVPFSGQGPGKTEVAPTGGAGGLEGKEKASEEASGGSKDASDPVVVAFSDMTETEMTAEVRGSAVVKNVSEKAVNGITAVAHFIDGYGKDVRAEREVVGSLAPGQSKEVSFYFIRSTGIKLTLKVELEWEGKSKSQ